MSALSLLRLLRLEFLLFLLLLRLLLLLLLLALAFPLPFLLLLLLLLLGLLLQLRLRFLALLLPPASASESASASVLPRLRDFCASLFALLPAKACRILIGFSVGIDNIRLPPRLSICCSCSGLRPSSLYSIMVLRGAAAAAVAASKGVISPRLMRSARALASCSAASSLPAAMSPAAAALLLPAAAAAAAAIGGSASPRSLYSPERCSSMPLISCLFSRTLSSSTMFFTPAVRISCGRQTTYTTLSILHNQFTSGKH
jgi:hypothetical protein